MIFEWNPSEKVLAKARLVNELHEKGMTHRQIAEQLGYTRRYVTALNSLYKQNREEKHENL